MIAEDEAHVAKQAPQPTTTPHNPDGLTPEVSDGYRRLERDEIKQRQPHPDIEIWLGSRWQNGCEGSDITGIYRIKLSREELAKLP